MLCICVPVLLELSNIKLCGTRPLQAVDRRSRETNVEKEALLEKTSGGCSYRRAHNTHEQKEEGPEKNLQSKRRHCGLVGSAPTWNGTGCEFDSGKFRIYMPCSLSLRLLGSLRGSLGTYGLTQKLCLKKCQSMSGSKCCRTISNKCT